MTKSLTERYKNKELSGWHYVKTKDGHICHWLLFTDTIEFEKDIDEILAPVPSYDKYKKLQEQLDEAKTENNNLLNDIVDLNLTIQHKEEQLNEANAIIDLYFPKDKKINAVCVKPINDYRGKWGVK